jgi:hypothetical protein
MFELITGAKMDFYMDVPHLRWHDSFADYSSHLSDHDDYAFDRVDNFERMKKFTPLKKHVVGSTGIIPRVDSEDKFTFFDIQGESLYSNPPNPESPLIDHGIDEDDIWAFPRSVFNQ